MKFVLQKILMIAANNINNKFLKILLWKLAGFKIGKGIKIGKNVKIIAKHVRIGNYVHIGDNVKIIGLNSITIGDFTDISDNVVINGDSELYIGDNCYIGISSIINVRRPVKIQDNVALGGAYVQLWTHSTWLEEIENFNVKNKFASIEIGKNSYIGAGSIILPGIFIGESVVVGAGSVVTKNLSPNALYVGVPAKFKKKINNNELEYSKIQKIIIDFLKDTYNYTFYPDDKGKVIFTSGNIYDLIKMYPKKSIFDLKYKICYLANKEGIKIKRKLNEYIARFKVIK